MVMGPSRLWPVRDVHCKIQTRPLVRVGALHDEGSTCQTKEHVKSGHGPQRVARHQDVLDDWPSVANSTPLHSVTVSCAQPTDWPIPGLKTLFQQETHYSAEKWRNMIDEARIWKEGSNAIFRYTVKSVSKNCLTETAKCWAVIKITCAVCNKWQYYGTLPLACLSCCVLCVFIQFAPGSK
jgi:hypothetical protein